MIINVNGIEREATEEEIAEILELQNREKLESMQSMVVTTNDLLTYLLSQVNVTLPDGTQTTGDKIADQPIELPFKLGQKCEVIAGSNGMAFQFVPDPDAIGTGEDNPIIYYDGCPLILNAFYRFHDNSIKVWANEWVDW